MVTPLLPKLFVKETTETYGGSKSHSMIPNIQMKVDYQKHQTSLG
jgi:hypothetical protein